MKRLKVCINSCPKNLNEMKTFGFREMTETRHEMND